MATHIDTFSPSRRGRTASIVAIAAALFAQSAVAMAATPQADVAALSGEVRGWVDGDDGDSAAWIAARVEAGLPAGVLAALADACRAHPRLDLLPVLASLSEYRRAEVRARALAARAALGGTFAVSAIEAAADDLDPGVRRVALALAIVHPSSAADEVVTKLLARDPALSEPSDGASVPAAPPAAEEDEVVMIDETPEEVPFNFVDPGVPLENPHPPPDLGVAP